MSDGIQTTLEVLEATRNEAAVDILIAQLDSPHAKIRDGAFETLLKRRSPAGRTEVLRRLHDLPDHWKPIVERYYGRMSTVLRDAVLGRDPLLCQNACNAILWFREYDLLPALVNAAEDRTNANADSAAATVRRLAERLHDEVSSPSRSSVRRVPHRLRGELVQCLEESTSRYPKHKRLELVEAYLVLVGRDNYTLRRILSAPLDPCHRCIIESLTKSPLDGVMRLLLSYFNDGNAPRAAIQVFAHRNDPRFQTLFFHSLLDDYSAAARRHLKQLKHITWLCRDGIALDKLDAQAQQGLIRLIVASGSTRAAKLDPLEYLLEEGEPLARRDACAALADFSGQRANEIILDALQDEDPEVRAEAILQLRPRGIPGALAELIRFVESPDAAVRDAAQTALGEFTFARFLATYETLDEAVIKTTGMLVRKVDPCAVDLLQKELTAPTPTRRLRAINMAVAMKVVPQVADILCEFIAEDDEHFVRSAAVGALNGHDSPAIRAALESALHDRNTSVKEAAKAALAELGVSPGRASEQVSR